MSEPVQMAAVVAAAIVALVIASMVAGHYRHKTDLIDQAARMERMSRKVEANEEDNKRSFGARLADTITRDTPAFGGGRSADPYAVGRTRGFPTPDGLGIVAERPDPGPDDAAKWHGSEDYPAPRPIRDDPQA